MPLASRRRQTPGTRRRSASRRYESITGVSARTALASAIGVATAISTVLAGLIAWDLTVHCNTRNVEFRTRNSCHELLIPNSQFVHVLLLQGTVFRPCRSQGVTAGRSRRAGAR